MSKVLKLYNTFTRTLNNVELSGKLITTENSQLINGSFYICGPTVYSDCHVGHALTYIRADLFRRFMKSLFNVRLNTVMNITDIDDKILDKTMKENEDLVAMQNATDDPSTHPFNKVSEKYYNAFLKDLKTINVLPADLYVKVSKHVNLITNYIRKLERNGNAYMAQNGDVYFNVNSVKNYVGRVDNRMSMIQRLEGEANTNDDENIKNDKRDFVLWKAAKPNEPVWFYKSALNNKTVPGRPGWHVQCSAISNALFKDKLDFHFGGKDLIFPHHYNEEACCCAYNNLDTTKTLHVWAKNWLHSGHLILRDSKMSKSIGNVIAINNFIGRSSVNALRLLCINTHYRADISFNEELLDKLKTLDHKINAFNSFLSEELRDRQESLSNAAIDEEEEEEGADSSDSVINDRDLERAINLTQQEILDGVCDDFHLDRGLDSIINLSKIIYSKNIRALETRNLILIWSLLKEWCSTCGLSYGSGSGGGDDTKRQDDELTLKLLLTFRNRIRNWAINEIKEGGGNGNRESIGKLLKDCDNVRSELNELGFVARDKKIFD